MLTAYFDRIYVINLASRSDRRAEMAQELARLGLGFESAQVQLFAAHRPDSAGDFPSIGAHGCFMSHLNVLRDARQRGLRFLMILEDDCDFLGLDRVRAALLALDAERHGRGWDFFHGGPEGWKPQQRSAGAVLTEVEPATDLLTTHCLGLSAAAVAAAVPYLEAMLERPAGDAAGGPMPIDGALGWLRRAHPHLRTLVADPRICAQRPSASSIATPNWYDTYPGIAPFVNRYRALKRRLRAALNGDPSLRHEVGPPADAAGKQH